MTQELVNTIKSKLKNEMDCKVTMNQITYGRINTIRVMSWGVTTRTNFENKVPPVKVVPQSAPIISTIKKVFKKYGVERAWTQDAKCIVCNRKQYSPVFIKGFRQICQICIATDEKELRKKYEISTCLIGDD